MKWLAAFYFTFMFACLLVACMYQPQAKTIDNAAVILCDLYFAEKNVGLSVEDVEKKLCSTAKDLQPFIGAAHEASLVGGKARTGATR